MRETGVVRLRKATPEIAARLYSVARTLMGRMKAYLGGASGAKVWQLPDGTRIRTESGPHGDVVDIAVPAAHSDAGCTPLDEILTGFVTQPHSDSLPLPRGLTPLDVPDDPDSVRPEVIYKPLSTVHPLQQQYKLYLWAPRWVPTGAHNARIYTKRIVDTCGHVEPWYEDRVKYGNIDWRGKNKIILTWLGVPTRYFDGTMFWASPSGSDVFEDREEHGQMGLTYGLFSARIQAKVFEGHVYYRGSVVQEQVGDDTIDFARANGLSGAWVVKAADSNKRYLISVHPSQTEDYNDATGGSGSVVTAEKVYASEITRLRNHELVVSNPQLCATFTWPLLGTAADDDPPSSRMRFYNLTPWLANESGTQAVTNRSGTEVPAGRMFRWFINVVATDESVAVSRVQSVASYDGPRSTTTTTTKTGSGVPDENYTNSIDVSSSFSSSETSLFADYRGDTLVFGSYVLTGSGSGSVDATVNSGVISSNSGSGTSSDTQTVEWVLTLDGTVAAQSTYTITDGYTYSVTSTSGSSTFTGTSDERRVPSFVGLDLRERVAVLQVMRTTASSATTLASGSDIGDHTDVSSILSGYTVSAILEVYRGASLLYSYVVDTQVVPPSSSSGTGGPMDTLIAVEVGSSTETNTVSSNPPGDYPQRNNQRVGKITAQGARFGWAVYKGGTVFVEFPLIFEDPGWETTFGKPVGVYVDNADPALLLGLTGANKRFYKVSVL